MAGSSNWRASDFLNHSPRLSSDSLVDKKKKIFTCFSTIVSSSNNEWEIWVSECLLLT